MGVDTPDRDELLRQFRAAHAEFRDQASQRRGWGFWTGAGRRLIGPFNAAGVARLYRLLLGVAFVVGVVLALLGGTVGQLGSAMVIGSIFAFGSWMAQAWALSREAEFKVEDDLLFAIERARLAPYADRVLELERQLRALPPRQPGHQMADPANAGPPEVPPGGFCLWRRLSQRLQEQPVQLSLLRLAQRAQ